MEADSGIFSDLRLAGVQRPPQPAAMHTRVTNRPAALRGALLLPLPILPPPLCGQEERRTDLFLKD